MTAGSRGFTLLELMVVVALAAMMAAGLTFSLRDGSLQIIDFKTGSTPTAKQVAQGFAPQLTLTAAILADGGFADAPPTPASELLYVKVTGRKTPGESVDVGKVGRNQPLTASELAERELARLVDGVAAFDDEARP